MFLAVFDLLALTQGGLTLLRLYALSLWPFPSCQVPPPHGRVKWFRRISPRKPFPDAKKPFSPVGEDGRKSSSAKVSGMVSNGV